jgi:hypothetical protein
LHSLLNTLRIPVRWHPTLWLTALMAQVLALFGSAIYVVLRRQLYASFDKEVLDQVAPTLAAVRVEDGAPTLVPFVAKQNLVVARVHTPPRGDPMCNLQSLGMTP